MIITHSADVNFELVSWLICIYRISLCVAKCACLRRITIKVSLQLILLFSFEDQIMKKHFSM